MKAILWIGTVLGSLSVLIADVLIVSVIYTGFNLYLLGKYKKYSRELSNIFYGWMDRQYLLGKCLLFSQNVCWSLDRILSRTAESLNVYSNYYTWLISNHILIKFTISTPVVVGIFKGFCIVKYWSCKETYSRWLK